MPTGPAPLTTTPDGGTQVVNEAASEFGLSRRTDIVTGAARGLGRAMALAIAAAGGGVVAVARTEAQLKETAVPPAAWRDLMAIHL
jgi:NADP-dependent 3-hydroxy acid dehydrogenase YdfG